MDHAGNPVHRVSRRAVVSEERRKAARTREREQSRREIAAYVAEGSITPDDAVRLMAAGASLKDKLTE